jgi:transposase-like protein
MGTNSRTVDGRRWRQWTEQEARTALEELARSGVSLSEFARRKGVSVNRLVYWKKRLIPARPPAFVAVTLPHGASSPSPLLEILVGGVVVRVPDDADAERVAGIVRALTRRVEGC